MKMRAIFVLHPRLDRPRRGRPDAPVDRARGEPAPHPAARRLAALRHRGVGRRVDRGDRARGRADVPAVHAAERAVPEARCRDRSRRSAAAATCWPTGAAAARRVVMIATGSEVGIAMEARAALAAEGIAVRVVSMPCTQAFDRQDAAWRETVLPPSAAARRRRGRGHRRLAQVRRRARRSARRRVGIDTFGESAPGPVLFKHFGITADGVAAAVRRVAAA